MTAPHLKRVATYLASKGNIVLPKGSPSFASLLSKQSPTLLTNYSHLIECVERRKFLHKLDTGAEIKLGHKEMTKRSAARSGFQMPKEYSPREDSP